MRGEGGGGPSPLSSWPTHSCPSAAPERGRAGLPARPPCRAARRPSPFAPRGAQSKSGRQWPPRGSKQTTPHSAPDLPDLETSSRVPQPASLVAAVSCWAPASAKRLCASASLPVPCLCPTLASCPLPGSLSAWFNHTSAHKCAGTRTSKCFTHPPLHFPKLMKTPWKTKAPGPASVLKPRFRANSGCAVAPPDQREGRPYVSF